MMILGNFIDYMVRCTELTAIKSFESAGLGDEQNADKIAVDTMRGYLQSLDIDIKVVIGEGERDKAPMLFMGELLGNKNSESKLDIAVDPLECTTNCVEMRSGGSLSVLIFAQRNNIISSPDVYMDKIVVSKNIFSNGNISINNSVSENLKAIAKIKQSKPEDITVIVLDRKRHDKIISEIRLFGAKIKIIKDGDISAVMNVIYGEADMYIGIGGAPEGVISASIVNSLGGYMESRLIFDEKNWFKAQKLGLKNRNKIYNSSDLITGESVFVATAVTDGAILKGVRKISKDNYETNTIVIYRNTIRKTESKITL